MSLKQFELAFAEAAQELSLKGGLDEKGCATIRSSVPGMPPLHVAYLEAYDAVALLAEIGNVPDEDPGLYREFMEDAYLGGETRGGAYAVDPATGKVMLQNIIPADRLEGQGLAKLIGDFAEIAFKARRRLVRKAEEEDPSPEIPGMPEENAGNASLLGRIIG